MHFYSTDMNINNKLKFDNRRLFYKNSFKLTYSKYPFINLKNSKMFNSNLFKTTIIALFCFAFSTLQAQLVSVQDGNLKTNESEQTCVQVVMQPEAKEVKRAFKDFLNDEYDVKLKGIGFLSNKDVLTAEQTNISVISDKMMDLSAQVIEVNDKTQMCIAGSFGYDIAIDRYDYPQEYRAMRNIVLDFLDVYLPNYYQDRIEEKQEIVTNLQEERSDLTEDITDNKEEIEKLKKENEKLMKELEDTKKQLKSQTAQLENRKKNLNKVNNELRNNKK